MLFLRRLLWPVEDTAPSLEIPPEMVEIVLVLLSDPGETDVTEMMSLRMTDSPPGMPPGEIKVASGTRSMPRRVAKPRRMERRKTKVFHYL